MALIEVIIYIDTYILQGIQAIVSSQNKLLIPILNISLYQLNKRSMKYQNHALNIFGFLAKTNTAFGKQVNTSFQNYLQSFKREELSQKEQKYIASQLTAQKNFDQNINNLCLQLKKLKATILNINQVHAEFIKIKHQFQGYLQVFEILKEQENSASELSDQNQMIQQYLGLKQSFDSFVKMIKVRTTNQEVFGQQKLDPQIKNNYSNICKPGSLFLLSKDQNFNPKKFFSNKNQQEINFQLNVIINDICHKVCSAYDIINRKNPISFQKALRNINLRHVCRLLQFHLLSKSNTLFDINYSLKKNSKTDQKSFKDQYWIGQNLSKSNKMRDQYSCQNLMNFILAFPDHHSKLYKKKHQSSESKQENNKNTQNDQCTCSIIQKLKKQFIIDKAQKEIMKQTFSKYLEDTYIRKKEENKIYKKKRVKDKKKQIEQQGKQQRQQQQKRQQLRDYQEVNSQYDANFPQLQFQPCLFPFLQQSRNIFIGNIGYQNFCQDEE